MEIACLDLEGVLVPEIWIRVAESTGIEGLKATTRDIPDYDELMRQRLALLAEHELGLQAIESVIAGIEPLPGAVDFLTWLRERYQVVILSDTFYEFAKPLMRQLGWPTLLCHRLDVAEGGRIDGYRLRQSDAKRQAVKAFQSLEFNVLATGDSYNDVNMLMQAQAGILFAAPEKVIADYPDLAVAEDYAALQRAFEQSSEALRARP